jgi:hypothetical protein
MKDKKYLVVYPNPKGGINSIGIFEAPDAEFALGRAQEEWSIAWKYVPKVRVDVMELDTLKADWTYTP